MTPEQMKAARRAIDLTRDQLAELAGCHPDTIKGYEAGKGQGKGTTRARIVEALKAKGATAKGSTLTVRVPND